VVATRDAANTERVPRSFTSSVTRPRCLSALLLSLAATRQSDIWWEAVASPYAIQCCVNKTLCGRWTRLATDGDFIKTSHPLASAFENESSGVVENSHTKRDSMSTIIPLMFFIFNLPIKLTECACKHKLCVQFALRIVFHLYLYVKPLKRE